MKKKFAYLILAASLALSACGGKEPASTDTKGSETSVSSSVSTSVFVSKQETSVSTEPEPVEETITPIETMVLGTYEQDGDPANGAEPVEWIVLYKDDEKALLLSRYILDNMPFNKDYKECSWESSSLRKELNGNFINTVFTAEEQARIISSKVPTVDPEAFIKEYQEAQKAAASEASASAASASDSSSASSEGAEGSAETEEIPEVPSTEDKVFLLSDFEVRKYLLDDQDIAGDEPWGKPSTYAASQGVYTLSGEDYVLFKYADKYSEDTIGAGWWWLRTSGATGFKAMDVTSTGEIRANGHDVIENHDGVRPAMWVNLK